MRIIRSVRHKVCVDGAFMKEVLLDGPVTPPFVEFLKSFGDVMLLPDIGPGFFKFEFRDGFTIKGWTGDETMEIRYRREVQDLCEDFVSVLFYYYHDGRPDMKRLMRMAAALNEKIDRRLYGTQS